MTAASDGMGLGDAVAAQQAPSCPHFCAHEHAERPPATDHRAGALACVHHLARPPTPPAPPQGIPQPDCSKPPNLPASPLPRLRYPAPRPAQHCLQLRYVIMQCCRSLYPCRQLHPALSDISAFPTPPMTPSRYNPPHLPHLSTSARSMALSARPTACCSLSTLTTQHCPFTALRLSHVPYPAPRTCA